MIPNGHTNQRYPKPPSIPRSQSSKNLQQAAKTSSYLKTGRRILHRSYSLPNVSYTNGLKITKPERNSAFVPGNDLRNGLHNRYEGHKKPDNGFKGQNLFNGFKRQNLNNVFKTKNPDAKELPDVTVKRKLTSLPEKSNGLFVMVNPMDKVRCKDKELEEPFAVLNESVFDLNQSPVDLDFNKLPTSKRHAVFIIDHEDGCLQATSNLLPVPEEPEHQPHVNSPWKYYSNESNLRPMNKSFDSTNKRPAGSKTHMSPWGCYGDDSKYHVIDELFDSDDEGLVAKKHELVDSKLDPVKKAMIDSWIVDVTLNTSRPNID